MFNCLEYSPYSNSVRTNRSYLSPLVADIGFKAYADIEPDEFDLHYQDREETEGEIYYELPQYIRETVEEGQRLYNLYKPLSDSSTLEESIAEQRLKALRSNFVSKSTVRRILAHQVQYDDYPHSKLSSDDRRTTLSNLAIAHLCWGGDHSLFWALEVLNGEHQPVNQDAKLSDSIYRFSEYDNSSVIQWTDIKPIQLESSDESNLKLKVPVARFGSWKNPVYGDIVFDQSTYDSFIQNFNSNVTGYEPPLFVGHPISVDTIEGSPANGYLEELIQEDDVLWAIASDVDRDTYSNVSSGRYRYASAEIIPDGFNKLDGSNVGPLLIGLALTNRPFVPGLPRVSALAETIEGNVLLSSFNVVPDNLKTEMTNQTNKQTTNQAHPKTQMTSQPSIVNQSEGTNLDTEAMNQPNYSNRELELADRFSELSQRLELAEKQLQEQTLANFQDRLDRMTLSDSVKQKFSSMVNSNKFSREQIEEVLSGLEEMSSTNEKELLSQHGEHQTLADRNTEEPTKDPYSKVIERNRKLALNK